MPDTRFVPRSALEVLENVPESTLRRIKQYSGRLATDAVGVMAERLSFFEDLTADQRASVQLVVQTAVAKFVEWMADPQSNTDHTAEAFALVPADLTRTISLRHTVDMVRVAMEYFEQVVPLLARSEEQLTALTVGILRYSRDLAFAAASGYANAAEARGSWDARMEASVVDAVVRGDAVEMRALLALLAHHGIVSRIEDPLRFAERNLVRHTPSGVDLDISLAWSGFEKEALDARTEAKFGRTQAPMATPEALVVFKAIAARPKDLDDIHALLALHPDIDVARVRAHVQQLAELAGDDEIEKGFETAVAKARAIPRRSAKARPKKPRQ